LERFGIQLIDLKISGVSIRPEDEITWKEWQERLFYLKSGARSEMVLTKDMLVQSSRELGKSSGGAGFGAGIAMLPTIGTGMMQQAGQQPTAQQTTEKRACTNCGALIPADSKFCPECGKKVGSKMNKK